MRWTVPFGLSLGKVVMIGEAPCAIPARRSVFRGQAEGGPEWNVQLQITPVIPKLISKTLFGGS